MKKRKEKNVLFLYVLKMLLIFVSINLLLLILSTLIGTFSIYTRYGRELIYEMFYALFVLIVMLAFKNSYVFTEKKSKFIEGIKLALPMVLLSVIVLFQSISELKGFNLTNFVCVLLLSIFVGIAEEFLCRGWLQNEFIERFSNNKNMIIRSILLSSFVFGFIHILNIGSQTLFETILQIINATSIGFLLGSIYYKTKNIYSVIFLHAFYDFAIMLGEINLIKTCTFNEQTLPIIIVNSMQIIFISFLWIFSAIKVLKKCDFPDEKAEIKKTNPYINTVIVVAFILTFVPFENLVYDYDEYKVCYNYEEKEINDSFTTHYIHSTEYKISNQNKDLSYEKDNESIKEIVDITKYNYKFYIEEDKVYIENTNTGYKVSLDYYSIADIEMIETSDKFLLLIYTLENEATIYYSEFMNKENMSNDNQYIDNVKNSFSKYEFPLLDSIGYITFEGHDEKYPFMLSLDGEYFMIENRKLYIMKEGKKNEKDMEENRE